MRGFKALNTDMFSKYGDMTYELGIKYTITGDLIPCENGYHFCKNLEDIEGYYTISDSRIFEVEAEGQMIEDDGKICAESITLIRELSKEEIRRYFKNNQEQILAKNWCCRKALAGQGLYLDILVNDEDCDVREAVAEQGYGLDILINDEDWRVRETVAKQGYGLDILVHDKDWYVRVAVAEQNYGLNILIYDKNWYVRTAVAKQGYGLDILINDKSCYVRAAAKEMMETLR